MLGSEESSVKFELLSQGVMNGTTEVDVSKTFDCLFIIAIKKIHSCFIVYLNVRMEVVVIYPSSNLKLVFPMIEHCRSYCW